MNPTLKSGLQQECTQVKHKAKKILKLIKYASIAILGWLMMVVAAPIAAMHVSNEGIYPLLGGLFVMFLFFLGAQIAGDGANKFEEERRPKTMGEILKGLDLPPIPKDRKILSSHH